MDMPKPGDAHKKLSALIGDWSGRETLHPSPWDPAGGTATATVTNRWIVDGFAVVQDYAQRRGGKVTFRGHGVFWFDPVQQEYVMHWWDSMSGTSAEYRGQFTDNVLTLGAPMPQGGRSRTSWTITGRDGHTFLMEVSPDGQAWNPAMEGRYRKGAATPLAGARKTGAAKPSLKAAKKTAMRPAKKAVKAVKKVAKKAAKKSAKKPTANARRR